MMTENLILIGVLWWMFHSVFRDVMLDRLRLKLYGIRDKMLLLVADEKLAADDAAYTSLRRLLNGSIRFAQEYSFVPFILLFLATRRKSNTIVTISEWRQSVDQLADSDVREKLHSFHAEMHWHIFQYIVMTSLAMWFVAIPLLFFVKRNRVAGRVAAIKRWFGAGRIHQLANWLDNAAIVEMKTA
jgi:hypothetical protein